jgi:hypothetical protein
MKGSKYLWLFAEENIPETMAERFASTKKGEISKEKGERARYCYLIFHPLQSRMSP